MTCQDFLYITTNIGHVTLFGVRLDWCQPFYSS